MSSSERSVRSLTFTFQRTAKADAPEASHSFGSQLKSTPPKRSRSSTDAKSVAANCGSISRKTAPGPRASSAISGPPPDRNDYGRGDGGGRYDRGGGDDAPSTGRRSPKAAAEAYAARSEASSDPERPTNTSD